MRDYKTSEDQRAKMTAYYYSHRQQILEQKRKERAIIRQHKKEQREREKQDEQTKEYQRILETWNLELIEKLETNPPLPKWMIKMMYNQIIHNNNRINQLEQYGQNCNTR